MKNVLCLFFLFFTFLSFSQTKVLSWNLENFGKSKSASTLNYIAKKASGYDIIAIQEVVAGSGGAQTVAKLAQLLNEKGFKWEYTISNPTTSSSYKTERYAFIWKTSKAKLKNQPWLEKQYSIEIDREPYYATFEINKKSITLVNFHAITKKKQPETEIKYFKFLPAVYPNLNLVFLGDFNCPETHSVFNPLKKMGYASVLKNQKTTLKQKCKNNICLASEFDNIFYKTSSLKVLNYGVIKFYEDFESLQEARKISDHIPIWFEFSLN
ncbi:endonuclease/exonuclease/phosphatase family metal-dependent hydrolase [Flavobacterium nitrogenifigens]|uniref:Endonuclease/exonuclease/phosphatase family metal-dependent hydrolase n=2 Tax=Flavobacterium TaxID=237 RepID=A0A7W7NA79_9FLAO|nr:MULTISPECIES: endonuclease/exonuclease/phosphatase family protein [Flavobacterium]MBB4804256.1 endonuclease/exonuclease/phosphatase family metal-dependent hydrolase [Flavobacterium nitrogenifigens]MBB6389348.1 endonuclease/exonuclease/phosphatase family metal-dependent hydrolase [Flavobacterium notoginsengisoli]